MSYPSWANAEMSKVVADVLAVGEGQAYEFKADLNDDGHRFAKSAAAMATAGGGLIFIGVKNDGSVGGLNESDLDRLYHQAQNIIERVQPAVAHRITQCWADGPILVVCIHNDQSEPVFFYDGRPYIRVGKKSRPATPDEVKEKVWSHPSSAQKLRDEELKHEMRKAAWELSVKRTAAADEASARSIENIQRTNDMLRQSVIPK